MAGLQDTIKKNKGMLVRSSTGELTEQTPEETQNLAGQAGLKAPPTTPMGVGMIGGNPDQQKMAGTPAQKQSALTLATSPDQTLQNTLRRQQVRDQATQSEEAQAQKSQNLKDLGGLGDRVNTFINAQRAHLGELAGQGVMVKNAANITGAGGAAIAPENAAEVKDLVGKFRNDPTNQDLLLSLNKALGYDANTQLSPADVDKLYESATSALATSGAGNTANEFNVDTLVKDPNFGYDKKTLSGILGVPEDSIGGMTVSQIRDQLNKVTADEFSKTAQLGKQAESGQLGQAERGLAREQGKEASRVGQRSTEADVAHLDQQIQNADQVSFGGKSYNVDDLLKDDTISGIITDYMNAPEGSPERAKLDKTEPELSSFINKNNALLQDASKQMQSGAGQFQETQAYNKALSTVGGVQLNDDLAKAVIPFYGTLQAQKFDPQRIPALKYASALTPQDQNKFATSMNTAVTQYPEMVQNLQGLEDQDYAFLTPESTNPVSVLTI